jgi:hypothetical protein
VRGEGAWGSILRCDEWRASLLSAARTRTAAPVSAEIALANENNVLVTRGAAKVTSVDFSMVGPIKSEKPL